jgi:hypothetical protein
LQDGFFKPKIQIWVNFGGSCNVCCSIFYVHLVFFTAICHLSWQFGIFSGCFWYILSCLGMLYLATLDDSFTNASGHPDVVKLGCLLRGSSKITLRAH